MSLFDFLAWVAIAGGLAVGLLAAASEGVGGAAWGALRGALLGYAGWCVAMLALFATVWLWLQWRPFFPRCREGRCRDRDYQYLHLDQPAAGWQAALEAAHGSLLVRCRCGTLYLESPRQRRFFVVTEDGALEPYMRYRPFGRWQRDPDAP